MDEDKSRDNLVKQLEKSARHLESNTTKQFQDDKSLCTTCRWATITRRSSRNNRSIHCTQLGQIMPEDILECNSYSNQLEMSLETMASLAIIIEVRDYTKDGYK